MPFGFLVYMVDWTLASAGVGLLVWQGQRGNFSTPNLLLSQAKGGGVFLAQRYTGRDLRGFSVDPAHRQPRQGFVGAFLFFQRLL